MNNLIPSTAAPNQQTNLSFPFLSLRMKGWKKDGCWRAMPQPAEIKQSNYFSSFLKRKVKFDLIDWRQERSALLVVGLLSLSCAVMGGGTASAPRREKTSQTKHHQPLHKEWMSWMKKAICWIDLMELKKGSKCGMNETKWTGLQALAR